MKLQLLLLLTSGSSFRGSVVEGQDEAFPGVPYPDSGQRCVDKVIMEEKTVWDDVINCDHSYDTRCFTSMSTTYESVQEEECNDNYIKNCFLSYETRAAKETVKICRTPLVKDCTADGEEICRTEYESECWTKQEEHEVEDDVVECETVNEEKCEEEVSGYTTRQKCSKWPREVCSVSKKATRKLTPITACTKEPTEICAPAGCALVPGEEVCHDKVQTVVHEAPVEECSLDPQRSCKHVTKLLPRLEPVENCVDVPKEVCVRSQVNPQKKAYPVVKKWCYTYGETTERPTCRQECKDVADDWRAGKYVTCDPGCRDEARRFPECRCECPKPCQEAARRREVKEECKPWYDDPKCEVISDPVCRPFCKNIADDWKAGKYVTCEPSCRDEAIRFPGECSCECPKPCQDASRRGEYKEECEPWHEDPKCKPPPPMCRQECKDIAADWRRGKYVTCDPKCESEARKFPDECSCECPKPCQEASRRKEYKEECEPWHDDPKCKPPPPMCRQECKDIADDWRAGKYVTCDRNCESEARKFPECSCECPKPCQEASRRGQYKEECEPWHDDPKCKPPPPPPECRQECKDIAADWRAGKYVTCDPNCKSEARKFPECSCECPKPCQEASRRGQYKEQCEPWHDDPKCRPPPPKTTTTPAPKCPDRCKRKCVDGELEACPRDCRDWCDDPTCGTCTVTCPHKCSESNFCRTGGRLGTEQCSCNGVTECDGVPGCCPSKFSFLIPSFGVPIVYPEDDLVDLRQG